jgi:hypothetical protein
MPHGSHEKFLQVEVINSLKQESEITSHFIKNFSWLLDGTCCSKSCKLINTWTMPMDRNSLTALANKSSERQLMKEGKIPRA